MYGGVGILSNSLFPRCCSFSAAAIVRSQHYYLYYWNNNNLINTSSRLNKKNLVAPPLKTRIMGCNSISTEASPKSSVSSKKDKKDQVVEEKSNKPWLIVGLGNPGKLYSGTRHNVGFEMIDYIAESEGISMNAVSFKASFGKGFIGDVPVMFAKPQTFMNASGESVGAIVNYYKIPLKQVIVMFDDMDLPFAKLRLLPKGGHGGHNGMRSIINHLKGSKDFPRLRIGIGRPPGKMNPASFVLRAFTRDERRELDFTLQNGLEAVRILVNDNFDKSATFVNSAKSLQY